MNEIEFEPILTAFGRIALSIRPPGTWFNSNRFHVFVGGGGRGKHKTLASAKKFLLEQAIAECDKRIARAEADIKDYKHERKKLVTHGLRVEKPKRKAKR